MWRSIILLALLLCAITIGARGDTQLDFLTATQIKHLREDAQRNRTNAEGDLSRAKQWRELESRARNYAAAATNSEYRDAWNKDAEYDAAQAQTLEENASKLKRLAESQEASATEIESRARAEAAAGAAAAANQPAPQPVTTPTDAEALRMQAKWQRSRAADLQEVAGRWRSAARHLQAMNAKSTAARRAAVEETVGLYEAQSSKLDSDAQAALGVARGLEELASALPPDLRSAKKKGPRLPPPDSFEGRWIANQGDPLKEIEVKIRRLETSPYVGFTLDTPKYHWLGLYDEDPKPRHGRVSFTTTPSAKGMNLDIPLWAREQVVSTLQWRLDLDTEGSCGISEISGKWFPGEVTWDPASQKAWVTGEGKPVQFEFKKAEEPPEEAKGYTSIFAVSATKVASDYKPIRAIGRGLPFRIKAVLPSTEGRQVGEELVVAMTGAKGEFTVTLKGTPIPAGPWVYISPPIQFARNRGIDEKIIQAYIEQVMRMVPGGVPTSLTRDAGEHQATFETTDGEIVTVKTGNARSTFAVFDDPPSFGTYQVRRALNDLEISLRSAVLLGAVTPAQAPDVDRKLAMILNARTYLAYEAGTTERWPRQLPVAVGMQYLRLLKQPPDGFGAKTSDKTDQGAVFDSAVEKEAIEKTINDAKNQAISDYFKDLIERLKSGIDEKKFINAYLPFDVEDLKITFLGEDWAGQPVDRLTRGLAGTRLALSTFVAVAGVSGEAGPAVRGSKPAALGAEREVGVVASRVSAAEAQSSTFLRMSAMDGPSNLLHVPMQEPGLFPRVVVPDLEPSAAKVRETMVRKLGTEEFEILKPTQAAIDHAAAGGYCVKSGCTLASITYILEERGIAQVTSDTLHQLLSTNFGINVILDKGANMLVVRDILEGLYGAMTEIHTTTAFHWGNFNNIERGLAKGKRYLTTIRYAESAELHAVVITRTERGLVSGKDAITHVTFFDVNAGAEIRMPCRVFRDELWLKAYQSASNGPNSHILEVGFKQ